MKYKLFTKVTTITEVIKVRAGLGGKEYTDESLKEFVLNGYGRRISIEDEVKIVSISEVEE